MKTNGAVIVVPHFDDELYCAGSYLVTYPHQINLIITHPTDTCKSDKYKSQVKMFEESVKQLNEYRKFLGFDPIFPKVIEGAGPNGLPPDLYLSAITAIENACNDFEKIDYYVYTLKSGHQSHTECNNIARAVLRHDFLAKMKYVLEAPYPMLYFTPSSFSNDDRNYNAFRSIDVVGMQLIYDIINTTYKAKSPPNSILGAKSFKTSMEFYGICIGTEYAQPFICKRVLL